MHWAKCRAEETLHTMNNEWTIGLSISDTITVHEEWKTIPQSARIDYYLNYHLHLTCAWFALLLYISPVPDPDAPTIRKASTDISTWTTEWTWGRRLWTSSLNPLQIRISCSWPHWHWCQGRRRLWWRECSQLWKVTFGKYSCRVGLMVELTLMLAPFPIARRLVMDPRQKL